MLLADLIIGVDDLMHSANNPSLIPGRIVLDAKALSYGAPPHGGIALGFDRIMMFLLNTESIRDVIAFPKTQRASCLMTEAPSNVSEDQLEELQLRIRASAAKQN